MINWLETVKIKLSPTNQYCTFKQLSSNKFGIMFDKRVTQLELSDKIKRICPSVEDMMYIIARQNENPQKNRIHNGRIILTRTVAKRLVYLQFQTGPKYIQLDKQLKKIQNTKIEKEKLQSQQITKLKSQLNKRQKQILQLKTHVNEQDDQSSSENFVENRSQSSQIEIQKVPDRSRINENKITNPIFDQTTSYSANFFIFPDKKDNLMIAITKGCGQQRSQQVVSVHPVTPENNVMQVRVIKNSKGQIYVGLVNQERRKEMSSLKKKGCVCLGFNLPIGKIYNEEQDEVLEKKSYEKSRLAMHPYEIAFDFKTTQIVFYCKSVQLKRIKSPILGNLYFYVEMGTKFDMIQTRISKIA